MKIKSLIVAIVCAMFVVSVNGMVFAQGAAPAPAPAAPMDGKKEMAPKKKKAAKKAKKAPAAPAAPAPAAPAK
jgi:hypothetical protein